MLLPGPQRTCRGVLFIGAHQLIKAWAVIIYNPKWPNDWMDVCWDHTFPTKPLKWHAKVLEPPSMYRIQKTMWAHCQGTVSERQTAKACGGQTIQTCSKYEDRKRKETKGWGKNSLQSRDTKSLTETVTICPCSPLRKNCHLMTSVRHWSLENGNMTAPLLTHSYLLELFT